jgi:chaperonin GroEL
MLSNFTKISYNTFSYLSPIFFYSKEIVHGSQARNYLLNGVNKLTNTVSLTLGPKGRNIIYDTDFGEAKITKDGVTITKQIEFKNKFENIGASLIKQVANRTSKLSGDGTTTASILTREIFREGIKSIEAGMNPREIRKGMLSALKEINNYLKSHSIPIKNKEDLIKVATISANNDNEIGKLIGETFNKIGIDGTINVINGNTLNHKIEYSKGMKFENGFISQYFITNIKNKKCEFNNPFILMFSDNKKPEIEEISKILEFVLKKQRPLIIISNEIDDDLLAILIINKIKGSLKSCVIKAPSFGDESQELLNDFAFFCGGKIIDENFNLKTISNFENILGSVKKSIISKDESIFIEGNGDKKLIENQINYLKNEGKKMINNYDIEKNKKRIAKLSGKIATLKVGGINETETNEIKDRIDDAICATKAAMEEGVLPGGGISLLYSSKTLDKLKIKNNIDFNYGIDIIKKTLKIPLKIICENSGLNADFVIEKLLNQNNEKIGINALNGKICDLYENGIIDPTKVVRTSIESAVNLASLMLTTEGIIVKNDFEEKNKIKI